MVPFYTENPFIVVIEIEDKLEISKISSIFYCKSGISNGQFLFQDVSKISE